MPYNDTNELPKGAKENLPKPAQEIYKEAFNGALDEYGEESRAHRVAWSTVETKYEKDENGEWRRKKDR
ncbi:putative cation transport regulator ChaB [soil metagenome]|jgi:cation transport regulator